MPIDSHSGNPLPPTVTGPEAMLQAIKEAGLIPFFANPIPGYSIEEKTPPGDWFTGESLGPWDWKIYCVQSGEIAYGKFLWGGKAAFATVDVYRELMNWRRSQPRYAPTADQQRVLDLIERQGSVGVRDVRELLGIKKGAADSLLSRLQMQTRVITGDIERVYRGAELRYEGWQRSSFCSPESLFEEEEFPFPGFVPRSLRSAHTPEESLEYLMDTIHRAAPSATRAQMEKMLR